MDRTKRILLALLTFALAATAAACSEPAGAGATEDDAPEPAEKAPEEPAADGGESDGEAAETVFSLASAAYEDGDAIPLEYARGGVVGGKNVSPPLDWADAPAGTNSFALVCVDRNPIANEWIHWMVVDIPSGVTGLAKGASGTDMPSGARELDNTWGEPGWGGPQPPPGSGEHEYEITVYALDALSLDLPQDADFSAFLAEVRDRMLGAATLSGVFEQ